MYMPIYLTFYFLLPKFWVFFSRFHTFPDFLANNADNLSIMLIPPHILDFNHDINGADI